LPFFPCSRSCTLWWRERSPARANALHSVKSQIVNVVELIGYPFKEKARKEQQNEPAADLALVGLLALEFRQVSHIHSWVVAQRVAQIFIQCVVEAFFLGKLATKKICETTTPKKRRQSSSEALCHT
jgi:hypothetical protein